LGKKAKGGIGPQEECKKFLPVSGFGTGNAFQSSVRRSLRSKRRISQNNEGGEEGRDKKANQSPFV